MLPQAQERYGHAGKGCGAALQTGIRAALGTGHGLIGSLAYLFHLRLTLRRKGAMALDALQQRQLRAERSAHTPRDHPAIRDHAAQRDYAGTPANDYTACDHTALVGPGTGMRPDTINAGTAPRPGHHRHQPCRRHQIWAIEHRTHPRETDRGADDVRQMYDV